MRNVAHPLFSYVIFIFCQIKKASVAGQQLLLIATTLIVLLQKLYRDLCSFAREKKRIIEQRSKNTLGNIPLKGIFSDRIGIKNRKPKLPAGQELCRTD